MPALDSERSPAELCADVMERIADQAQRAGEVIRQIRRLVRKEDPECQLVHLSEIVKNVTRLIRHDVQREGVQFQLKLDLAADRVLAQPIQIEQVMLNLVRNAIEAMGEVPQERRSLTIGSAPAGANRVRLEVADSGPGLIPEVADSVFNPFVTTKPQGMGLGLSVSSGIVESHGGQLTVESKPGRGAVFSFTLPAHSG